MKKLSKRTKEAEILAPLGSAEYGRRVREIYSETLNEPVILSDTLYDTLSKHDEIVDSINKLKNEKDRIEHTIMSLMKENDTAYIKDRIVTWKKTTRSSLDTKRLKEEEPEIYSKYSKVSSSRIFISNLPYLS